MALIPYLFNERPHRVMNREIFGSEFLQPFHQLVPQQFFRQWNNDYNPWEFNSNMTNVVKQMEQLYSEMNNMALKNTKASDADKFQVNVDVQHFSPEEISVTVIDGYITVEGKHEEKQDEHGYISRKFVRRYALPKGCLPDAVESKLSSDGVLTVTAPRVLPLPSTGERIVPIKQSGPIKKQIGSSDNVIKE